MVQDFKFATNQEENSKMNPQLDVQKIQLEFQADIIKNMQFGLIVWHLKDPKDITSFQLVTNNRAASQLTGVSLENYVGKRMSECFSTIAENRERYAEVARSGCQTDQHEVYYGDELMGGKFFSVKVFPLPNQCIGVVFDNITERKQAEEALRESDERFRATFEQAAVGIAHVGLDGRWLRVNQKLCEIVGYSPEELIKLKFQDITHPDDLETDLNYIRQLLTGEIEHFSLEKRYIHKSGSIVWINLTVSLAYEGGTRQECFQSSITKNCEPKYFISVIEEINDRKEAEIFLEQRADELTRVNTILAQTTTMLKKRNDELDQFAYVASHDLKAPLRAIASLSEWMEEDLADKLPEENQQQMRLLRGRVRRMEALINGLLEYSRVGRIHSPLLMVNVTTLVKEVIDTLAPPPTFTIEVEPGMPTFVTKRLLLQQVFSNLIGNAINHHTCSNGHIKISVQDREKYYEFAVSDDGPGIAPEYQNKVF
ncbi:MAG: PAS domain S-box protein, partial [Scytonema sp. PMC 1069.18]|nr:PAS domain S-box protein [Scytonema sp. PMC 1069.18]